MIIKEDVVSTSEIGRIFKVQINASILSEILQPAFKTELGTYWYRSELPALAVGLAARFTNIGLELLRNKNDC